MATTTVGGDRQSDVAVQKYRDALFIRTDFPLYLGNSGEFKVLYDSTYTDAFTSGADLRMSDTQVLNFGDGADAGITWNGTQLALTGTWSLSGADLQLSDTQKLILGNEGSSDSGLQWSGSDVRLASASDLQLVAANNFISRVTAGITRPTVSDAWYLKSDTAGGGFYVMVSSG